jgi:hypothetical protein
MTRPEITGNDAVARIATATIAVAGIALMALVIVQSWQVFAR